MPYKDPEKKRANGKAYREAHREKLLEYHRNYNRTKRDPEAEKKRKRQAYVRKGRARVMQCRYGITPRDRRRLLLKQHGLCGNLACDRKETRLRRLHIDHSHITDHVRGLLCSRCNTALGQLEDRTDLILGLIDYLERTN